MANNEEQVMEQAEADVQEVRFLEQAITATRQTPADETQDLLKTLTQEAMNGTVKWDKNLTVTINRAIAAVDQLMSQQLSEIMHHEKFQKLEGSWRGLNHLVMNSETGSQLKIRMLNLSKKELTKDLERGD